MPRSSGKLVVPYQHFTVQFPTGVLIPTGTSHRPETSLFECTATNSKVQSIRTIRSLAIASKSRGKNRDRTLLETFLELSSTRILLCFYSVALPRESLFAGSRAKISRMRSRTCAYIYVPRTRRIAKIAEKPRVEQRRRKSATDGRMDDRRRLRAELNCGSRAENTI